MDLGELEGSPVYLISSRTARATQGEPVSKKPKVFAVQESGPNFEFSEPK